VEGYWVSSTEEGSPEGTGTITGMIQQGLNDYVKDGTEKKGDGTVE
jgi:hypothetical protein